MNQENNGGNSKKGLDLEVLDAFRQGDGGSRAIQKVIDKTIEKDKLSEVKNG